MWSTNYDGEHVVLTRTAPSGFIRTHIPEFRVLLREEIENIGTYGYNGRSMKSLRPAVEKAVEVAARRMAKIISQSAPYDSGDLARSIRVRKAEVEGKEMKLSFRVRV
jgi:hypothetical protein